MLVNAKPEELIKYSKGEYDKEKFIEEASKLWDWTDKQIRLIYITADLAIKGQGVFSVSNEKLREMFENRFKMTISRSTVIRFFQLLEELKLLTVNEARRRNRKQSANIFIIEPMITNEIPVDTPDETPCGILFETLDETHNIAFNNVLNIDFNLDTNIPLRYNIFGNNLLTTKEETINKLVLEYMKKGLSKQVCFLVLKEIEATPDVKNFGGYFRTCLENALYKSRLKKGLVDLDERFEEIRRRTGAPYYNWLEGGS